MGTCSLQVLPFSLLRAANKSRGPAPADKLRDELQLAWPKLLDCFASLAMTISQFDT
jgi:hypothetical protein